ncbi:MAG: ATP-binding protein, partial [Spirochaetota bacterium]
EDDLKPVRGNIYKFEQVVLNILSNAKDALEEKAQRINRDDYQKIITIHGYNAMDRVCLEISDSGIGIPPEILKDVFNPFFTSKPVDKGTGLGLSITYGIIKEMGGNIDISSEENHYTNVRITIPAA